MNYSDKDVHQNKLNAFSKEYLQKLHRLYHQKIYFHVHQNKPLLYHQIQKVKIHKNHFNKYPLDLPASNIHHVIIINNLYHQHVGYPVINLPVRKKENH